MARFFQPKKSPSPTQKHQQLQFEKLDHHGAGIAYLNRKPLFVEGVLPQETAVIQVTETKSKYARGQLIKLLSSSEQRQAPFCPHYSQCGGCNLQHLVRPAQLDYKQDVLQQMMQRFADQNIALEPPLTGGDRAYRRRARVSLKWDRKSRQLQFGFRQKQSQRITDIEQCPVLEQSLNQLLPPLKLILSQFSQPEHLGHLELVAGDNQRIVVLRHLKPLAEKDRQQLLNLAEQHQLSVYLMPESGQLDLIAGEPGIYQETGCQIEFAPNNFIQVNQDVNRQMVQQAMDWLQLDSEDRVLDLFCGLGNFSLPIARLCQEVIGVEGVDAMVVKAAQNAALNQLDNARFYQANLEQDLTSQPWAQQQFNKILLDPARAGAAGVIDQVGRLGAERVVYVSCNPATLARDSQSLIAQGYQLTRLGMLDMFPHTSHMESMALFEKQQ